MSYFVVLFFKLGLQAYTYFFKLDFSSLRKRTHDEDIAAWLKYFLWYFRG